MAQESIKKHIQDELDEHREHIRRRHQEIISRAMLGKSKLTEKTTPDCEDLVLKDAAERLMDMSWANSSCETVLSSGEFSFDNSDLLDDFVSELEATIEKQETKIASLKETIETHKDEAKLSYISGDTSSAIESTRTVHSWQQKLLRSEWIHQELVSYLLFTKQDETESPENIEERREWVQKILDGDSPGPRIAIDLDDDTVLEQIQQIILENPEYNPNMRFMWFE